MRIPGAEKCARELGRPSGTSIIFSHFPTAEEPVTKLGRPSGTGIISSTFPSAKALG